MPNFRLHSTNYLSVRSHRQYLSRASDIPVAKTNQLKIIMKLSQAEHNTPDFIKRDHGAYRKIDKSIGGKIIWRILNYQKSSIKSSKITRKRVQFQLILDTMSFHNYMFGLLLQSLILNIQSKQLHFSCDGTSTNFDLRILRFFGLGFLRYLLGFSSFSDSTFFVLYFFDATGLTRRGAKIEQGE